MELGIVGCRAQRHLGGDPGGVRVGAHLARVSMEGVHLSESQAPCHPIREMIGAQAEDESLSCVVQGLAEVRDHRHVGRECGRVDLLGSRGEHPPSPEAPAVAARGGQRAHPLPRLEPGYA